MKITFLLLLIGCLHLSAASFSQTINLKARNEPLAAILEVVKAQTGYAVIYNNKLITGAKPVTVTAKDMQLEEFLNYILKSNSLTYAITQQTILIKAAQGRTDVVSERPVDNAVTREHIVAGKVTDEKGMGIPNVNVRLKKGAVGTTTDAQGNYNIRLPNENIVLVFSFLGFATQEINVDARKIINVTLIPQENDMDEVVVVGYGDQKKKLLSTAISSLSAKEIENMPVGNPGEAMAGQIAGVNIAQTSGDPGNAPVIMIRGVGSISAGKGPLYVVDGYPLNNADNFNQINPSDIESIQVLKDAAAAAIYGSRGGNGIIIVTTKKGVEGVTKFSFNSVSGIQDVAKKIDVLNRDQYVDYVKDAFTRSGKTLPVIYNDPLSLPDTDWQDEIFRTGIQSNSSITASGGSSRFKFSITGSYFKQNGTLKATDFNRYTLRTNIQAELLKKLKLGFNIAPSYTITNSMPTAGSINFAAVPGIGASPDGIGATVLSALLQPPILPVKDANGNYSSASLTLSSGGQVFNGNPYNPVAVLDLYKDKTSSGRLLSTTYLEYDVVPGLKLKTSFGFEAIINNRKWFVPATLMSDNAPNANVSTPVLNNVRSRLTNGTNYNWVSENTASYSKTIAGKHNFSLLAGYSLQKNVYEENSQYGQNGTYTNYVVEYPTNAGVILGTARYSANALVSMFGRISYDYNNKYLISVALRSDGSSRFGSDNKYASFPAFSFAWRMGEEEFITKNLPFVSELKIRTSYGVTGNNNIGDFAWQSYATQVNYAFGANAGTQVFGFAPNSIAIKNLSWETNKQTDIGLELGLFKDRFYFTADAYVRNTTGLLLNRNVPGIIGFATSILNNVGEMKNTGLEFALRSVNIKAPFKWSSDLNISFNRNKVISLINNSYIGFNAASGYTNSLRVVPGESIGNFYGYKQIGVYRDAEDVNSSAKWASGGSNPGDIKYQDINDDGVINEKDITLIGTPLPKFTYGITNRFNYKRFEFSFLLQGSYGTQILNAADRYTNYFNGSFNVRTNALNRWKSVTEPGDGMTPKAILPNPSSVSVVSSRNIFDGSFLRIRNVTLGYTFSPEALKGLKLRSARLYVTGQNLYTFTKYFGFNPEVNVFGSSVEPRFGVDQGTYPVSRNISLGLEVNF